MTSSTTTPSRTVREADDTITLEEVPATTAKIQDSMARVVIEEERAERF